MSTSINTTSFRRPRFSSIGIASPWELIPRCGRELSRRRAFNHDRAAPIRHRDRALGRGGRRAEGLPARLLLGTRPFGRDIRVATARPRECATSYGRPGLRDRADAAGPRRRRLHAGGGMSAVQLTPILMEDRYGS